MRGSLGVASQSLKDWNDAIKEEERFLQSSGAPVSKWDTFGAGFPAGAEVGFFSNDMVSVGAGFAYQKSSVSNTVSDASASLSSSANVSVLSFVGNVSIWIPGTRGLFVGADGGVGLGKAKSEGHFRDFGDPTQDFDARGDWDGKGPVAGVFAGFQRSFPGGPLLFVKVGFQFQNLGEFDGTSGGTGQATQSGPPRKSSGQAMDTDFSGLQLAAGFGFALGPE